MNNFLPFRIAGIIFLIMGMVHLVRVSLKFPIVIAGFDVPVWASFPIGALCLGLSLWMLKSLRNLESNHK